LAQRGRLRLTCPQFGQTLLEVIAARPLRIRMRSSV
jgi:hypothetical protein